MRLPFVPLALAACSNANRGSVVQGGVGWERCPLQVDGKGPPTQCATVDVPLWPDEPDGPTIELFAQRHLARGGGDRVLWLLPGGPGQTGAVYESFVEDLDHALPHTDLYLFEHRGVGRSTRLGCPDQEDPASDGGIDVTGDEWPACLDRPRCAGRPAPLASVPEATWGSCGCTTSRSRSTATAPGRTSPCRRRSGTRGCG
ncbi:MAG: hypothetical protein ABMA64_23730 [Myxococcota bacterium]